MGMEKIMFDRKVFEKDYNARIGRLGKAEKSVREELNVLSRSVLEAVHATENIGYVNKLLGCLTPVNRKAAVVFFKHFTGFHYDEAVRSFTKKSKKRYDDAHKASLEFLQDPHNNMFSWAERHIEVEQKPFEALAFLKKQQKAFATALQTARDHGISQKELFSMLFKSEEGKPGIDAAALVEVLAAMGEVEVKEAPEALL